MSTGHRRAGADALPTEQWRVPIRGLRDLAFVTGWIFVATVPLINIVNIGGTETLSRATGLMFAMTASVALLLGRRHRLHDTHLVAMAFLLWAGLSYFWSVEPTKTLANVITLAQLVLVLLLLWEFAAGKARTLSLLRAYVLGAWVSLATLLWQAATGPADLARYTAAEAQPNSIAFVLTMAIPAAWYLGLLSPSRLAAIGYRLYPALALLGIALTGSRSALVAGGMAVMIIPLTWRRVSPVARTVPLIALALAGLVAVSVAPERPLERLGSFESEVAQGDLNGRTELWQTSMLVMGQRPVGGVGSGAARFTLGPDRGDFKGVHNTYLSVAVDLGVVGLALFLLLWISALQPLFRTRGLDRVFLVVMALTLAVGLLPRHWEYEKPTWLMLAFLLGLGTSVADLEASRE